MADIPIVLVTHAEYDKGKAVFESADALGLRCVACPAAELELAERAQSQGVRAVIVGVEPYTGPLYDALPKAGVISRFGVGHDGVDKALATARGILVTNTPGVLNTAVAEQTLWLIGAVARRIAALDRAVKRGKWEPATGFEVAGKTLVIVGLGAIGAAVARIAGLGFGMKVVACDCMPRDDLPSRFGVADWPSVQEQLGLSEYTTDLAQALTQADVVSAHLAFTPETAEFFDEAMFALMKPGAVFVNTARGGVVDEAALYQALETGHLAGAGLDVFAVEPYQPQDPSQDLRKLPNVVLTPHVASNTQEANARMAQAAMQNVARAMAGDYPVLPLVNPAVLERLS